MGRLPEDVAPERIDPQATLRGRFGTRDAPDPAMRANFVRTLIWRVPTSVGWLLGASLDPSARVHHPPLSGTRAAALVVGFVATVAVWRIYFYRGESIGISEIEQSGDMAAVGQRAIYALIVMIAGLVAVAVADELRRDPADDRSGMARPGLEPG
ncbi:MAG TPA: low temperature requirement protein A, partial [Capillimicrobium sp.]|nr:low temperature requirement protein A [Capillimicrobium sp.]